MTEQIPTGTWVEIHHILLPAGGRAPQVPEDTAGVALEMRVKGFLVAPSRLGKKAEIETVAGRRLTGTLSVVNPGYDHGFGAPIAELLDIGGELRTILNARKDMA